MRRRLFEGEIGIQVNNREHMELLAEMLEIQADGGDSAGEFVAYTIEQFEKELRARALEKRAQQLRQELCTYPDCRCPFDMGPDHQCLKGLPVIRK